MIINMFKPILKFIIIAILPAIVQRMDNIEIDNENIFRSLTSYEVLGYQQ